MFTRQIILVLKIVVSFNFPVVVVDCLHFFRVQMYTAVYSYSSLPWICRFFQSPGSCIGKDDDTPTFTL